MIKTSIIGLPIDMVKTQQNTLLAQHFSSSEKKELSSRHVRSMAGWLAAKRAVARLFSGMSYCLCEKDITLSRSSNGRPWIKNICDSHGSPLKITSRLTISISHTRITAYGMAVYQEP